MFVLICKHLKAITTFKRAAFLLLCFLMTVSVLSSCNAVESSDDSKPDATVESTAETTDGAGNEAIAPGIANVDGLVFLANADESAYKIVGYQGESSCVVLPTLYLGKPVTEIASHAFLNCEQLTDVTVPDSVTSIGFGAFEGCNRLDRITLPFIGATGDGNENPHFGYVFGASSDFGHEAHVPASLKAVTVTGGIRIGTSAFRNCSQLESITLPQSLVSIDNYAFRNCSGLKSLAIPASVTRIGNSAFRFCSSLTLIAVPEGVTAIGKEVFYHCDHLESITLPKGITEVGDYAFAYCTALADVKLSNRLASIGDYAFAYCKELSNVTVPEEVKRIGQGAFQGCDRLASITLPFVGTSRNVGKNSHFGFIFGAPDAGNNQAYLPVSLETVVITNDERISNFAFYGCCNLKSITLSDIVTTIEQSAFSGCSSLSELILSRRVWYIDDSAFSNCRSLKNVYYRGTPGDWSQLYVRSGNTALTSATRYYYSENKPITTGNYWHCVDGEPTPW